ncbi:MAG: hypothetical protein VR71_24100 [Roseovarius sp. BRH_c41]|uniref:hypothetical protein n=1 Tax=Roseovarius sp. BRH_c41 TaxID=1629709 RepID=UPI0005F0EF0F|nr:hypothetical protein [Roseovarius sp. BRH_c41]KJS40151.1 MAG: hypothetical protein VR71_24100 [Roseovarius sp. BRH_c41]
MRFTLGLVALVALVACAPAVPDSGAGVGFEDYGTYEREKAAREAALAQGALPPPDAVSTEPLNATGQAMSAGTDDAAAIAADARAALDAAAANSGEVPLQASPSNPPPAVENAAGISEENNFDAVGAERSIEEDAARIANNRAQYQVVQPQAIGSRPSDVGPNIVEYALSSKHAVGTPVYRRMGLSASSKFERNCAQYPSADQAQLDFLRRGGPEKDRQGLDPDGDGYACGWDPRPYRNAVRG